MHNFRDTRVTVFATYRANHWGRTCLLHAVYCAP